MRDAATRQRARGPRHGDDAAQMMLLTAVILLIGFVALAGMVARVSQLPDETLQERRRPAIVEAQAVADGLKAAWDRLETLTADEEELTAELDNAVAHLAVVAQARGFSFSGDASCAVSGTDPDDVVITVIVSFRRPDTEVALTLTRPYEDTVCSSV